MKFLDELANTLEEGITLSTFVQKVSQYSTLDLALAELPSEYIDFYSSNERLLNKQLKKLNLLESAESMGYTGMSPTEETVRKKIKYKGEILILEWDADSSVWIPLVAKRSIVQALKLGRVMIDNIKI